jgi:tripartite-type tricarboxylate transporter receptor subunit TctC
VVPKGTPAPVRAKLVEACRKATAEPAFKEAMRVQGTRVAFLDDQGYAAFLSKLDGETKAIMLRLELLKN